MPIAEARVRTQNPSRHLVHLCQHAKKLDHSGLRRLHGHAGRAAPAVLGVEWTASAGTLRLTLGTCILHAEGDTLTVRAEADDEASLKRLQELITADLERFGRRDGVTVSWTRPG